MPYNDFSRLRTTSAFIFTPLRINKIENGMKTKLKIIDLSSLHKKKTDERENNFIKLVFSIMIKNYI